MFGFIENLLGAFTGDNSVFDEARESVVGGCLGTFLSGIFLFVFYFLIIALLSGGIVDLNMQFSLSSLPFICVIGLSALASPFIGIFFGLQRGEYSSTRHMGCSLLWLSILILAVMVLSFII